ncbi:signal recognition particle receptor subunit beta [Onthophagus taurus]|uniref:signal recognition particle receptor subunit beta n=1 Tax=Onthophagus taurus TaxID=166361 RepID=UPI0039BDCE6B
MENGHTNESKETISYSPIIVALITLLITIVLFFIYKAKQSSKRTVLITGLCNSGKTLLFTRLVHQKFVDTYTSMKENTGNYLINNLSLRIVDIPGHERVRDKFFEKYKKEARALVYVVDSSLIEKEVRDVAEYLYNILLELGAMNNKVKVLILCNKQDVASSKNSMAVKCILEKELTTLQRTKSSQLDSVDPKVKKGDSFLSEGEDFHFSLLSPIQIEFANGFATNETKDSINVDELEKWLVKVA